MKVQLLSKTTVIGTERMHFGACQLTIDKRVL